MERDQNKGRQLRKEEEGLEKEKVTLVLPFPLPFSYIFPNNV